VILSSPQSLKHKKTKYRNCLKELHPTLPSGVTSTNLPTLGMHMRPPETKYLQFHRRFQKLSESPSKILNLARFIKLWVSVTDYLACNPRRGKNLTFNSFQAHVEAQDSPSFTSVQPAQPRRIRSSEGRDSPPFGKAYESVNLVSELHSFISILSHARR
jgi:hypothetical protein